MDRDPSLLTARCSRRRRGASVRCGRGSPAARRPGLALGVEAGEQQTGLDLGAGHRQLVLDPVQGSAVDLIGGRRSSRSRAQPPSGRSGPATRSTGRRRIESSPSSVQRPPSCPASQPGRSRSRVPALPTSIAAARRRAGRRRGCEATPRSRSRPGPAGSGSGSTRPRRPGPAPRPASNGCRRRRGSPRSWSPPRRSPRSARPDGRSICRRVDAGTAQGAGGVGRRPVPLPEVQFVTGHQFFLSSSSG